MLSGKKALLLDMNSTFMFGEDRFDESEDFSRYYFEIGGTLPKKDIQNIIRATYRYLEVRYPDAAYCETFPSLESGIQAITGNKIDGEEVKKIVQTFTFHELGYIPYEYAEALHTLKERFTLGAVIDIWSPKEAWLSAFGDAGIADVFSIISFSSDHGIVKPSPIPFESVLSKLGLAKSEAIAVGDSPRRDLGGARNAGIDCVLVGGAKHPDALGSFGTLLDLCNAR